MTVRDIVQEETSRAGERRHRVLTLLDRLHRDRMITFDQFAAGNMLRTQLMEAAGPSAGISSYGGNIGHADASTKADRLGERLTGFRVDYAGHVYFLGGRQWDDHRRKLENALFAACGCIDDAGQRRVNILHATVLIET